MDSERGCRTGHRVHDVLRGTLVAEHLHDRIVERPAHGGAVGGVEPELHVAGVPQAAEHQLQVLVLDTSQDPKSTRLNSSHVSTSYAVFCLQKKIRDQAWLVEICVTLGKE